MEAYIHMCRDELLFAIHQIAVDVTSKSNAEFPDNSKLHICIRVVVNDDVAHQYLLTPRRWLFASVPLLASVCH